MKTAIVIPARWNSSRLPGKPLAIIAGRTMLSRVTALARTATEGMETQIVVATDDERIAAHCLELNVECLMTGECQTGTERVYAAILQLPTTPDFVVNLQGDAALTPPDFVRALIESWRAHPCDVVTPVARLSWDDLDRLREAKKVTPYSGTTVTFNATTGRAFWFSKAILPVIRGEEAQRQAGGMSPVWRQIGLYGFDREMLARYRMMTPGYYEQIEGLEQLRILEHGGEIRCVPVDYRGRANMSGIDSPEDIVRAEALIAQHGELLP